MMKESKALVYNISVNSDKKLDFKSTHDNIGEYEGLLTINFNGKAKELNIKRGDGVAFYYNDIVTVIKPSTNDADVFIVSQNSQNKDLIYSKQLLSSIELKHYDEREYTESKIGKVKDDQLQIDIYYNNNNVIEEKGGNSDIDIKKIAYFIRMYGEITDKKEFLGIQPGNNNFFTKDANDGHLVSVSNAVQALCRNFIDKQKQYTKADKITINLGACFINNPDIPQLLREVNKILPANTKVVIEFSDEFVSLHTMINRKPQNITAKPTTKIQYTVGNNYYDLKYKTADYRLDKYSKQFRGEDYLHTPSKTINFNLADEIKNNLSTTILPELIQSSAYSLERRKYSKRDVYPLYHGSKRIKSRRNTISPQSTSLLHGKKYGGIPKRFIRKNSSNRFSKRWNKFDIAIRKRLKRKKGNYILARKEYEIKNTFNINNTRKWQF